MASGLVLGRKIERTMLEKDGLNNSALYMEGKVYINYYYTQLPALHSASFLKHRPL